VKFKNEKEFEAFKAKQKEQKLILEENRRMNNDGVEPINQPEGMPRTIGKMRPAVGNVQPAAPQKTKLEELEDELENKRIEKEIKEKEKEIKNIEFQSKHPILSKVLNVSKETSDEISRQAKHNKKSSKVEEEEEEDEDEDNEDNEEFEDDDEFITELLKGDKDKKKKKKDKKSSNKSSDLINNLANGDYKGAYGQGLGGDQEYVPVFKANIGNAEYKNPFTYKGSWLSGENPPVSPVIMNRKRTPVEEETDDETEELKENTSREFKSAGFPNTLPAGMMTSPLFKREPVPMQPAPQISSVPQQGVVTPYVPRAPMMRPPQGNLPRVFLPQSPQQRFIQQRVMQQPPSVLPRPQIGGSLPRIGVLNNNPMPKMGGALIRSPMLYPPRIMATPTPEQRETLARAESGITILGRSLNRNQQSSSTPLVSLKSGSIPRSNPSIGQVTIFGVPLHKKKKAM
jgi:hypothetical protein